ncbi:MAG: ABC transporter permease [Actinomycetota bacterium]
MTSTIENNEVVVLKPEKKEPLGVFFWVCVGWLGVNLLAAIFANFLPIWGPQDSNNYVDLNTGPSFSHLLGTDDLGRDILSRIIYGARVSLGVSFGAMFLAFFIGGIFGMYAAYRRGKLDLILTSVSLVFLAFPSIIAVIAVLSFWTPRSILKITIVIAVTSIPLVYRVIRAATLSAATKDYVLAAKIQGATDRRIMTKELLPNILPTAVSFVMIGIASVIVVEGSLAFLGLSTNVTTPSWGNMINESRSVMQVNPWLVLFPSLAMCLLILSLNFIGDRIRSYYDVSEVKL